MDPEPVPTSSGSRLKNGGWVLIVSGFVCLFLFVWAITPAMLRMANRPPGDGQTIESYAFDLSNPDIDPHLLEPALAHRDLVPVMETPSILSMDEINELNANRRTRYLVSDDLIIGVEHNGEARAYPLSVLNVHELVHDELGGTPILVTWHWPSAASRVLVRPTPDSRFGISGLVAGGNGLIYPRREEDQPAGGEPLQSPLMARTVTGPGAGQSISTLSHKLIRWEDWKDLHPESTAIAPQPGLQKRYRKSDPFTYYASNTLMYPALTPSEGPSSKTWVTIVNQNGIQRAYAWPWLQKHATDGRLELPHGNQGIRFELTQNPHTVVVVDAETGESIDAIQCLWFTWNGLNRSADLLHGGHALPQ